MENAIRKKILAKLPYGLYVIGAGTIDDAITIVANWVCQVSFNPMLVSMAIEYDSQMREYIQQLNLFSVNLLASGSITSANAFIKKSKQIDRTINGKEITFTRHGTPFVKEAVASFECKVVSSFRTGDHLLFIGELMDSIIRSDAEILTLKETGWKYAR